ncbi:SEC-C metal-binding domain-containing protein [Mesobacillus boroniphilus]|nr:SEC-C metal-binding domain-containing protein [Mesobacillus boroniphilus]
MSEDNFLQLLRDAEMYPKGTEDFRTAVHLLLGAPSAFLKENEEEVTKLLDKKGRQYLDELLKLDSMAAPELFAELAKLAAAIETRYDHAKFMLAEVILKRLSMRKDWDRKLVGKMIFQALEGDFATVHEIFFVMLAGIERMDQFTSQLVKLLFRELDDDLLVEEAIKSLIKIGTDEVVDAATPYVNDEETGPFALDIIREIKSEHAEEVLLDLMEEVEMEPVRTLVAYALCTQLSVRSIPSVEKVLNEDHASWFVDLTEALYCNCVMNRVDHPQLKQWRNELKDMGVDDESMASFFSMVQKKEPVKVEIKIGRNDPCTCGSGKKYKKCCGK